jgi:Xaa-Pro aminopeptidase
LNIRGYDLPYTPVVLSRLILFKGEIKFFVNKRTLPFQKFMFKANKISIFDINDFESELLKVSKKSKIFIDNEISFYFYDLLKKNDCNIQSGVDPCKLLKSQKNNSEIKYSKLAHLYDGIALVDFFYWLDKQPFTNDLTELKVAKKLEYLRARSKYFFSLSFPTISATGSNASIIHYNPEGQIQILKKGQLFLCDSGAQYFGGTTDVTRTVILGKKKPKNEYIDLYTKVLIGHINISMMRFPIGTKGYQIDAIGRYALWNDGLDYNHGTGHGVGSFLNVHEGPQSIGKKYTNFDLKPGMILSNEPGYYRKKKFGIRIENLIIVKKSKINDFLEFETLTLCPYDLNLIDVRLLNYDQKKWLNNYHFRVYSELSNFLDLKTKKWLKTKINPV